MSQVILNVECSECQKPLDLSGVKIGEHELFATTCEECKAELTISVNINVRKAL